MTTYKIIKPHPEPIPKGFAEEVLEHVASGKTLTSYCKQPNKPAYQRIKNWQTTNEEFAAAMVEACEIGREVIFYECLDICDDNSFGNTSELSSASIGWQKLKIDTRLRLLERLDAQKYGQRKIISGDAQNPVEVTKIARIIITPEDKF